jgi:hypothetical protein
MINNKLKFITLSIIIILEQSCNSVQTAKTNELQTVMTDSMPGKNRSMSQVTIVDSLPVYAELKVMPYTIDSIIAEVTIINDYDESVWLYKPALPTDSLVERSFYIFTDEVFTNARPGLLPGMSQDLDDSTEVPHIYKQTNHQYLCGNQDLMPSIIPIIADTSQIELKPGKRLVFVINLAKQYDFKSRKINRKKAKTFRVHYSMEFPFVKNGKHISLLDKWGKWNVPNDPRPAYLAITCKDISVEVDKKIHVGYILPSH